MNFEVPRNGLWFTFKSTEKTAKFVFDELNALFDDPRDYKKVMQDDFTKMTYAVMVHADVIDNYARKRKPETIEELSRTHNQVDYSLLQIRAMVDEMRFQSSRNTSISPNLGGMCIDFTQWFRPFIYGEKKIRVGAFKYHKQKMIYHSWFELADGVIFDPTADQFGIQKMFIYQSDKEYSRYVRNPNKRMVIA